MRQLTEDDIRGAFANANDDELRLLTLPLDFLLTDWDHLDFLAWRDPRTKGRGYLVAELGTGPSGSCSERQKAPRARGRRCATSATRCSRPIRCRCSRRARRATRDCAATRVGTYICADLSCHENVRLAAPLAPNEVRASVDARIDGTRRRAESFVERVLEREGGRMSNRVVVVGDALIDELRDDSGVREFVGGAALNVAVGLTRLGVPTTLIAMLGDDEAGAHIRAYLADYGVELIASPSAARHLAGGEHAQRVRRAGLRIQRGGPGAPHRLRRCEIRAAIADAAIVVVSCFPFDNAAQTELLPTRSRASRPVAIDPNPRSGMMTDRAEFVRGFEALAARRRWSRSARTTPPCCTANRSMRCAHA